MMRALAWSALFALSLAACRRADPAPAPKAASIRTASATARNLALANPSGHARIDLELRRLVAIAQAHPSRFATWIELGRSWVQKARESSDPGFYLNAEACAEVALGISPDDPLALELRALVWLNDHKFTDAKLLAEKMVKDRPDSAGAWGSLSDALLELGEHDAAERAALTMLDLKPNLPSYSRVSYLRWLRGQEAEARELARLAIDASDDPRRPEPRAWMITQTALLFWHRGDFAGADAGFQKALEVSPEYAPARVGRGRVALSAGEFARAATLFASAFQRSPLAETAWLLGQAHELDGNIEAAQRAYRDAEREGRRADPRTLSLMLSSQRREPVEALALAERERRVRGDVYTEDALAFALYRNGRFEEARSAIERARRLGTRDARLLFHEGAIRLALGEKHRGRQLLQSALAQNPHFDEFGAREAAELLRKAG